MSPRSDGSRMDGDGPTVDPDTHWSQVTQRHYEPDGTGELTTPIVFAIADAKGVSPSDLKSPPLYECVDASTLEDTFFGPSGAKRAPQDGGIVTFHYTGYKVALRADGWIFVYESR